MPDTVTDADERITPEEVDAEVNDLDKLLSCRCARCGEKIYLDHCEFDESFNAVCKDGCR